jgi:hypothetical protein
MRGKVERERLEPFHWIKILHVWKWNVGVKHKCRQKNIVKWLVKWPLFWFEAQN